MGRVRETPQKKKKIQIWMCKRNSPDLKKKKKKKKQGVSPHIKMKPVRDA